MGSVSAKKLKQVVENVAACLAIELIVGAAGVDQRAPLKPARGVIAAHQTLREHVLPLEDDRPLYLDIEAARRLIDDGSILAAAVHGVGTLH
jgi:histidine ammonia-lyase